MERERLAQLQRALDTLDEDKRAVFTLVELQGETVPSIAPALGIPLDTAYSRLRAARKLFRQAVAAESGEASPPAAPVAGESGGGGRNCTTIRLDSAHEASFTLRRDRDHGRRRVRQGASKSPGDPRK